MDNPSAIDFKFVETYLKDKFLRPFSRRLVYIYLGLDHDKDTFVLSDTEDTDFKYCESKQTTGVIKIANPEHLEKILAWFNFCKIDMTTPCIFYFSRVTALLNKVPWNDPDVKIERSRDGVVTMSVPGFDSIIISQKIDAHFTLMKLQGFVDKYTKAFFQDAELYYDLPMEVENKGAIIKQLVSCSDLHQAGVLDKPCEDVTLILITGLDILAVKSLIVKDKECQFGIRLWADNGRHCLNYGGFYRDADISICTCRDNIFIFPIIKKD